MKENASETVICEMAAILSPPQCVNDVPAEALMPLLLTEIDLNKGMDK